MHNGWKGIKQSPIDVKLNDLIDAVYASNEPMKENKDISVFTLWQLAPNIWCTRILYSIVNLNEDGHPEQRINIRPSLHTVNRFQCLIARSDELEQQKRNTESYAKIFGEDVK